MIMEVSCIMTRELSAEMEGQLLLQRNQGFVGWQIYCMMYTILQRRLLTGTKLGMAITAY